MTTTDELAQEYERRKAAAERINPLKDAEGFEEAVNKVAACAVKLIERGVPFRDGRFRPGEELHGTA